ncbi:MAG TPA: hypothetical protein VFZ78_06970 [Flavisolibacter sp.]
MQPNHFAKAALLTAVLVLTGLSAWEWHLRNKGLEISYDDGKELWAHVRAKAYADPATSTVFIGSSRIKYDLDISTWRKRTGRDAVQLAIEGSSPLPVLHDLANDDKFRGDLVVDVTEGLFFATRPGAADDPTQFKDYFYDQTPAQQFSCNIHRSLESGLVFLDRDNFSINAMLDKNRPADRPGVFNFPLFPLEFGRVTIGRQNLMTDEFLVDTSLQNMVTGNWLFFRSINKEPPASGARLDSIINAVKISVEKIRARGGSVLFVRTPSSGPFWKGEQAAFPREKYWERLLKGTNSPGVHFADYPETAGFICPEWSHLSPKDAITYTLRFADILENEQGWSFRRMTASK